MRQALEHAAERERLSTLAGPDTPRFASRSLARRVASVFFRAPDAPRETSLVAADPISQHHS